MTGIALLRSGIRGGHVIPNGVLIRRRMFALVNVCGFNTLQLCVFMRKLSVCIRKRES